MEPMETWAFVFGRGRAVGAIVSGLLTWPAEWSDSSVVKLGFASSLFSAGLVPRKILGAAW